MLEWSARKGIITYRQRLHVDLPSAERVSLRSVRRFSHMSSIEFPLKIEYQISTRENVYYDMFLIILVMILKYILFLIQTRYFKYHFWRVSPWKNNNIVSCHDSILIHVSISQEIAHYHRMNVTIQCDEESLGDDFYSRLRKFVDDMNADISNLHDTTDIYVSWIQSLYIYIYIYIYIYLWRRIFSNVMSDSWL